MGQQASAQPKIASLETSLRFEQEKRAELQGLYDRHRAAERTWRRQVQMAAAGGVGLALLMGGAGFLMLRRQSAAAAASLERALTTRHEAALSDARRRAKLDVDKANKFAVDRFAKDLLPVADSLTFALEHAAASVSATSSGPAPSPSDAASGSPSDAASGSSTDESAPTESALAEGIALTEQSLLNAFGKHGIHRQEALGQRFDPNAHEAVMRVVRTDAVEGEVAEVFRSGFAIHGRVLRAAQVSVVAPTPKQSTVNTSDDCKSGDTQVASTPLAEASS